MSDVLITGAAGFVGAALVRDCLAREASVTAVVRPSSDTWRLPEASSQLQVRHADLADAAELMAVLKADRPAHVFHMAAHGAYSWQTDPAAILETNVVGTANLLTACAAVGVQSFIHAGSSSEYGFKNHPPTEREVLEPNSVYAVGKAAASHLVGVFAASGDVPGATARLYSVYGPWEAPERLMPRLVTSALAGTWPPLASPSIARDFVFIDDALAALWAITETASALNGRAYNVCTGSQVTLRDLVAVAAEIFPVSHAPDWGGYEARSWDTDVWCGSPDRIGAVTSWRATTSLTVGLQAMADWIETESPAGRYTLI